MKIDLQLIEMMAKNTLSYKMGLSIYENKKLFNQFKSTDSTFYQTNIHGSSNKTYLTMVDFIDIKSPRSKCDCGSKYAPCKHAISLMIAISKDSPFAIIDIPNSIIAERNQRLSPKNGLAVNMKTVKKKESLLIENQSTKKNLKNIVVKKAQLQLKGISKAQSILNQIYRLGLSGLCLDIQDAIQSEIKNLALFDIKGIYNSFENLFYVITHTGHDNSHKEALAALNFLSALLDKAEAYLEKKIELAPDYLDIQTEIEELIGRVWKLEELEQYGLFSEHVNLIQIAFWVNHDEIRMQSIYQAFWFDINRGIIYKTIEQTKYKNKVGDINDTIFSRIEVPKMYIYPGRFNPKVKLSSFQLFGMNGIEFEFFNKYALNDFSILHSKVRKILQNPLSDRHPLFLVKAHHAEMIVLEETTNSIALKDVKGATILLQDSELFMEDGKIHNAIDALSILINKQLNEFVIAIMIDTDNLSSVITAKPLAIINQTNMVRLLY